MARVDVIMPQMGESIAEGTLSRWLKKAGDEIKRDEPIFEISTDKVDAEIPAPVAGVMAEILVKEGETVAVQTVVARIETEKGAAVSAPSADPAPAVAAAAGAQPAAVAAPATKPPQAQSPSAPVAASGGNGSSFEDRVQTRSSPLVRKIAAEHGLDLASMRGRGTGIAGRVTKKDILGFIESGPPAGAMAAHSPPAGAHGPAASAWPGDVVEPMSKMRALISDHMGVSRRTSAHVTSFMEIDLTRVSKIRAKKKAEFHAATGQNLTYLPFIIASAIDGLKKFPVMNASVSGNNIIYRKQYNIAIAVALDWGLIVPVIKQADNLSLAGLTRALNDLAARARAKRLSPDEVQDGTFTITNPGVFGSLMGTPIINQPQVAILGVGAIEKRPKVMSGPDGDDVL
ncbi:MAG: 2-oxo acid dehydrogenase subunit E2, partial [Gemmatimonadaceae bacterium]|nr:2-oxo acid dehydrogenase subunit E2 [Gemmatimonadaceae bacterium]